MKKAICYNYEIRKFDYTYDFVRDLVLVSYIRYKEYGKHSNILIISDKKSYYKFKKVVNNIIHGFTCDYLNAVQYNNGLIFRFLEKNQFTKSDIKYMKDKIAKSLTYKDKKQDKFYDIIILHDSFSISELESIITNFSVIQTSESNLLQSTFIYLPHYEKFQCSYDMSF